MSIHNNILNEKNLRKLQGLNNNHVIELVEKYIDLCKPGKVTVITDSEEDIGYVRDSALRNREESQLATQGHLVHFDGRYDQGRDKENTRVLLPKGEKLGALINTMDRDDGLSEIMELLDGIMEGKEMFVCFFCLGPVNSRFSIPALQITDSAYVGHSETILYRPGYEEFKNLNGSDRFFHFVHSAGELDESMNSKNVGKRRVYMDLENERVFTVNSQYAGNSVGLKKLALRLAISRADAEGWFCEHMLIMGAKPENKDRTTYFTGAFPSACGKTSTSMIPGQVIVGDDIAYMKPGKDGHAHAVNVEQGIFGIIADVNAVDDPLIYHALTTPRELIFSNVLVKDEKPFWLNMGETLPEDGFNYTGNWNKSDKDENGKDILPAHKNARYTIRIQELENADPKLNDPDGVPISGIVYGGRDSDTSPPVLQSLDWSHGVFIGATLESETTAATIGQEGIRKHNPMANLDFLVIPLGKYIDNHLKFGETLLKPPTIFATNYFLKENDRFVNEKTDKKVWLMWMEGRVCNEFDALRTPVGFIPKYEDLKNLFKRIFDKDYTEEEYDLQFSIRVEKLSDRLDRVEEIYKAEDGIPEAFLEHFSQQRERLRLVRAKSEKEVISPFDFE